jgi:hypothetical protein
MEVGIVLNLGFKVWSKENSHGFKRLPETVLSLGFKPEA